MNNRIRVALVGALIGIGTLAHGATLTVQNATVTRTLITSDTSLGGCMAALSLPVGTGCTSNWVTFSCSGNFTDKDRAYRMLDMAQMAYSLGKHVTVYVDTAKLHNGYCFANRIDVYN